MNVIDQVTVQTKPVSRDYQKWIQENYNRMLDETAFDEPGPRIYLITTKFNNLPSDATDALSRRNTFSGRFRETEERIQIVNGWQDDFYAHVLNQSVTNAHYKSKRNRYPIAYCFVDFPGSRDHKPRITEMPHFHSLFVVPSKTVMKFETLKDEHFRLHRSLNKTKPIQTVDCRDVYLGRDLSEVVSYSSKFLRQPPAKWFSQETQSALFTAFGRTANHKYV